MINQSRKLKEKVCKQCKVMFMPERPLQSVCTFQCSIKYQAFLNEKKVKKDWAKEKKVMVEKSLTHKDYLKLLQTIFNTFVRLRDKDLPCVSCGTSMANRKGDASHYFSVGSTSGLRFNEDNVHLGCVFCNQHKHGNIAEYSIRLPLRIGIDRFNDLKLNRNIPLKISIPEIKEKIIYYKKKIKELK